MIPFDRRWLQSPKNWTQTYILDPQRHYWTQMDLPIVNRSTNLKRSTSSPNYGGASLPSLWTDRQGIWRGTPDTRTTFPLRCCLWWLFTDCAMVNQSPSSRTIWEIDSFLPFVPASSYILKSQFPYESSKLLGKKTSWVKVWYCQNLLLDVFWVSMKGTPPNRDFSGCKAGYSHT